MVPFQHKCCWRVTQAHHEAGMGPQHGFVTWVCQDNRARLTPSRNKAILSHVRPAGHSIARLRLLQHSCWLLNTVSLLTEATRKGRPSPYSWDNLRTVLLGVLRRAWSFGAPPVGFPQAPQEAATPEGPFWPSRDPRASRSTADLSDLLLLDDTLCPTPQEDPIPSRPLLSRVGGALTHQPG